jgi:hypothetical protein
LPYDFPAGIQWADGTEITDAEALDIRLLRNYAVDLVERRERRMKRHRHQTKALRLLRRYLSPDQIAQLSRAGYFLTTTPGGATYRLYPRFGLAEQVTRHGKRWYVLVRFCIHEPDLDRSLLDDKTMPPADLTLTHLLLLQSDEQEFRRIANATMTGDMLWNGNWLRRLRQARMEREAACVESAAEENGSHSRAG